MAMFNSFLYVYQRVTSSPGTFGVRAAREVLGLHDAQFRIAGWHVAGAVDQIQDASARATILAWSIPEDFGIQWMPLKGKDIDRKLPWILPIFP